MDLGRALSTTFPQVSFFPLASPRSINVGTFHPEAIMYRNRYGVLPSDVYGWPYGIQHGQSTFWLSALFQHPTFLAEHPEFNGVTVAEPPSSQDMTDLQFATSPTIGGAYPYLKDFADRLGLLGDSRGTGPKAPAGLGGTNIQTLPPGAVVGAPGTGPGDGALISPTVPPPPPSNGGIPASAPGNPAPISVPSLTPPSSSSAADAIFESALIGFLESKYPGQGAKLAQLVQLFATVQAIAQ